MRRRWAGRRPRAARTRPLRPALSAERPDVAALVAGARAGSPRAVGRLISLVEDAEPALREVMAALAPDAGRARTVGVTGPPGVGKSTTTSALVGAYRGQGLRVGVLAVDPSSPFTGGALLGDRVRMQEHATDPGVYVRSMATRGRLGGLAQAVPAALRVLDAAGCDVVLVETVGVGQSEVDVAGLSDTTLVLLAPGAGDGVQAAKAGILEVGDVYVVNKADRDGADTTVRELRQMLTLGAAPGPGQWRAPVLPLVATRGEGLGELAAAIERHQQWGSSSGATRRRRLLRAEREVESIAVEELRRRHVGAAGGQTLRAAAERVLEGSADPWTAAETLVPRQP